MITIRRFSFVLAFMLGIVFTLISPIAAFANGDDILQRQQEVDQYLFETHAKEIGNQGFQVTHTRPNENYIEIGITPYNETYANYLYEHFGTEAIKVVDGEIAVTFTTQTASSITTSNSATNSAEISSANTAANSANRLTDSSSIPYFFYPLAVVLLVSIAVILIKKRLANK